MTMMIDLNIYIYKKPLWN